MRLVVTLFFAAFVVTSDASAQPDFETDDTARSCPPALSGAKLAVSNTSGGVVFRVTTTEPAHVETLRAIVKEMAIIVELHTQTHGEVVDADSVPPVRMQATNVNDGVLVTVRPSHPSHLDLVRTQAREVEQFWKVWPCVTNDAMPPVTRTRAIQR